jgi:hypothetical protein
MLCLCIFSARGIIQCVFCFHPLHSLATSSPKLPLMASSSFFGVHFELNLKIWSPYHTRVTNMLIDSVKLGFTCQISFTQTRHDSWVHVQKVWLLYLGMYNFVHTHHHFDLTWSNFTFFQFEFKFKSISIRYHLLTFFSHFFHYKP